MMGWDDDSGDVLLTTVVSPEREEDNARALLLKMVFFSDSNLQRIRKLKSL
jgi:hypothetical protein